MDDPKDPRIITSKNPLLEVIHTKRPFLSIASIHPGMTKSTLHMVWQSFNEIPPASLLLSINNIHAPIDVFSRCPRDLFKNVEKLILDIAIHAFMTGQYLNRIDVLYLAQVIACQLPPNN